MASNKKVILDYCKTIRTHDIDHLQNCLDNEHLIEQGRYTELTGCPSSYGLEDYKGLCEIENEGLDKQNEQCERCWTQALEV